jgi:hypothetical protein
VPLPDTAEELCTLARELKLAPDEILLGANATETNIKQLSVEEQLARYRVLPVGLQHGARWCTAHFRCELHLAGQAAPN